MLSKFSAIYLTLSMVIVAMGLMVHTAGADTFGIELWSLPDAMGGTLSTQSVTQPSN